MESYVKRKIKSLKVKVDLMEYLKINLSVKNR